MVLTRRNNSTGNSIIVLKPNNSATWTFNLTIFLSLAILAASTAYNFLLQGVWIIPVMTGLEIILLFVCLYLCARANVIMEVIRFYEHMVVIEKGHQRIENTWKYHREWAKVFVFDSAYANSPKRVFIRCYGKELELGAFLNKGDKEVFIRNLKKIIVKIS